MKNKFIEQIKRTKLNDIERLIDKGYIDDFNTLIEKLNNQIEYQGLPEGLQKKYDEIKDNPVDEPILYEIAKKIDNKEASIIDIVEHLMSYSEMDEYDAGSIAFFSGKIIKKISNFKDDEGVYKRTTNILNWQPPKASKIKDYEEIIKRLGGLGREVLTLKDQNDMVAIGEINARFEVLNGEFEKFLLLSCGLDGVALTDWEKALVVEMTKDAFQGYTNSFLGKI